MCVGVGVGVGVYDTSLCVYVCELERERRERGERERGERENGEKGEREKKSNRNKLLKMFLPILFNSLSS